MPLMTTQSSPWDTYPFRQAQVASLGSIPSGSTHSKLNGGSAALRDAAMSPASRGPSVSSGSSILNHRGSMPTLGSIGAMSTRGSMGSVGSLSSGESAGHSAAGSESSLNMWHSESISKGSSITAASSLAGSSASGVGPTALLIISGLPRDISARECHYIFALASDFSSVEISKNAVSGEISVNAKFGSVHGAQQAGQMLERRVDLFGCDLKTQIQTYSSPFISHTTTPRSLYPSRPLYGDSYWTQQPSTPLSPSTNADMFGSSRRQSLVSPTDAVYPSTQLGHMNLGASTPSHYMDHNSGSSGSSSNSVNGQSVVSAIMSPTHINGTSSSGPSPTSTPSAAAVGTAAAIGSGLASTPTVAPSMPPLSASAVQLSLTHPHNQTQQQQQQQHHQHHHHHNQLNNHSNHAMQSESQKLPPPNPADQNPPCNTLYVGNLPPDTSEVELKDIFSQQPGYRRLCFRTKQNGPMCFVEFEDEILAGKALSSLYGYALSNSVKGGIRLSYSKNPLGVRSRQLRK